MKRSLTIIALLLAVPTLATAGEIYGKVLAGGAPAKESAATVEITCGKKTYPAVKTDKSGSYHLVVDETGKCTLAVTWNGKTGSVEVGSYETAVQADLVVDVKDGALSVRRK